MTPLNVHLLYDYAPNVLDYLRTLLEPGIHITSGESVIPEKNLHILVAGRPDRALLTAHPELTALIVPWVGIPPQTRELLAGFPQIALYNLHHNAEPVAEMALALLLAAAKAVIPLDQALRRGDWSPRYNDPPSSLLLSGKTALILGMGAIGQLVARACQALNMTVLAIKRTVTPAAKLPFVDGVFSSFDLHDLLPRADALIVTLPLTPETEGLLGADELRLLPQHCVLVNIGRGSVIDEEALYMALKEHSIGAAGLDVWYNYPASDKERAGTLPAALPFWELENVVLSPHRAGLTEGIDLLRMRHLARLLNAAARNERIPNHVDLAAGY